jgi:hypothetical protein
MIRAMEGEPRPESRTASRIGAGFDPRTRIQRDPFNEYLVLVLSAGGAAVFNPIVLLVVSAIWEKPGLVVWVLGSVGLELFGIFGLARPAMKPKEALGWALLWSFAAAVLGLCFYELVANEVL